MVGASLEDEPEDVQPPGDNSASQNLYEVIGTLSDQANEKPSWISEIIPVSFVFIMMNEWVRSASFISNLFENLNSQMHSTTHNGSAI